MSSLTLQLKLFGVLAESNFIFSVRWFYTEMTMLLAKPTLTLRTATTSALQQNPYFETICQLKRLNILQSDEWLSWMTGLHPAIYDPANYLWKMQSMYPYKCSLRSWTVAARTQVHYFFFFLSNSNFWGALSPSTLLSLALLTIFEQYQAWTPISLLYFFKGPKKLRSCTAAARTQVQYFFFLIKLKW